MCIIAIPLTLRIEPTTIAMPEKNCIYSIRDMDRWQFPETRCKYIHVSSDAASMRHAVSGNSYQSTSLLVNGTAVFVHIELKCGVYERY